MDKTSLVTLLEAETDFLCSERLGVLDDLVHRKAQEICELYADQPGLQIDWLMAHGMTLEEISSELGVEGAMDVQA